MCHILQYILLCALPFPLPLVFNFLHIPLLKLCLFLPPSYRLELPFPHPDLIKRLCYCGRELVIWEFCFFLLLSKTMWALVYSPEPLCLDSKACCTLAHFRKEHYLEMLLAP